MSDWLETALKILTGVTPFVVAVGGVLVYVAQLRWSKKFIAAKDEIIKSKEAELATVRAQSGAVSIAKDEIIKAKDVHIALLEREIKSLQDMSSPKLKEIHLSYKDMMAKAYDTMQEQLAEAKKALEEDLIVLKATRDENAELLKRIGVERKKFEAIATAIETHILAPHESMTITYSNGDPESVLIGRQGVAIQEQGESA